MMNKFYLLVITMILLFTSCKKEKDIDLNPTPLVNKPPVANAGPDIFISLPANSITLNGSGSSDPGVDSDSYLALVDIYNAAGNSRSTIPLPNRAQDASIEIAAKVIGNKIYFAGSSGNWRGYDFGDVSSKINVYEAITNSCSTSDLNTAKGFLAGIVVDNKILGKRRYVSG